MVGIMDTQTAIFPGNHLVNVRFPWIPIFTLKAKPYGLLALLAHGTTVGPTKGREFVYEAVKCYFLI